VGKAIWVEVLVPGEVLWEEIWRFAWAAPVFMLAAWLVVVGEFGGLRRGPSGELSSDYPFTVLPFYPFTFLPFYPFTLLHFYPFTLSPFYPFTFFTGAARNLFFAR